MSQDDSQAVDITSVNGVTVDRARKRVAELVVYLRNRAETGSATRSYDVAAVQIAKIMDAVENGSDEDIWTATEGGVISGKDFAGVEFTAHSFEVSASSDQYDAPLEHFVSIHGSVLSVDPRFRIGEEIIINTGAPLVITMMRALEARDLLPADCVLVKIPARKGDVLKLQQAPVRAEQIPVS